MLVGYGALARKPARKKVSWSTDGDGKKYLVMGCCVVRNGERTLFPRFGGSVGNISGCHGNDEFRQY